MNKADNRFYREKMKAKNIHNDTDNEREVIFHSKAVQFAIVEPSDGEPELWEACDAQDPRRGIRIEGQCYRYLRSAKAYTPGRAV